MSDHYAVIGNAISQTKAPIDPWFVRQVMQSEGVWRVLLMR